MNGKCTKDGIRRFITNFSRGALYALAAGMLVWLNWNALFAGSQWYEQELGLNVAAIRLLLFILAALAAAGLGFLLDRLTVHKDRLEVIVLCICCLVFWLACVWWVYKVPYGMVGDQSIVWYNSVLALQGDFTMYQHGGQIFIYPQQQGLSFLYELLFRITGNTAPKLIGYVNAALAPVTLLFGYLSVRECADRKTAAYFLPLMILCLPYIIYSPYVYGDIPSISLSFVLLWAVLKFAGSRKYLFAALACVTAALALLCRMNMWIFFIGLIIGLLYETLDKWQIKPVLFALCIVLCASLGVNGVKQFNSLRSGYPVSKGMPSVLWMAMGLQFSEYGAGYYNNYSKWVFEQTDFDRELAAKIGTQEIKDRLDIFLSDSYQTRLFFQQKLYSQWIDPLFESMKFTGTFDGEPDYTILGLYYGEGHRTIRRFTGCMLSVIYFFALVGIIFRFFKKKSILQDSALIIFVGGFLFSVIWEAKARYMLPYFVLLHMYAAFGLRYTAMQIKIIFKKYKGFLRKGKVKSIE